jgi:DNA-binding response OmpR family regulator
MGNVLAAEPQYDRLRVVLGEGDPAVSESMGNALRSRGVRQLNSCSGTDQLFNSLDTEIVDLLVYDYDMLGTDFIDVMQRIRRKARGKNPFVIIVATVKDSAAETVQSLIGGGVDDLLRKPFSVDRLFESIGTFSHERKPFFVSYNYVGPTRRTGQRATEPANQIIRVPNTLRSRAIEMVGDDELERIVNAAVQGLEDKQIEALGIEIDVLATRVADSYGTPTGEADQDLKGWLYRMEAVADELRKRSRGTRYERVSELATMVIALTQRTLRTQGATGIEIQLLTKLSAAIRRALSVERNSLEIMREISRTIADFTRSH